MPIACFVCDLTKRRLSPNKKLYNVAEPVAIIQDVVPTIPDIVFRVRLLFGREKVFDKTGAD